jgi:dsDNA-specific endonuclease/ATPase MutS2
MQELKEREFTSAPERVSNHLMDDSDLDNPFPKPVEIEITDVFDLHTIPPRDVKRVVEEYLQLAREKGFKCVRIIHGKGIGVQREMVHSILTRTTFVSDWKDAPPQAGGLGATIVFISHKDAQNAQ